MSFQGFFPHRGFDGSALYRRRQPQFYPPSRNEQQTNQYLRWLDGNLKSGRMPSLGEMVHYSPPGMEPESPESLHFQARVAGLFENYGMDASYRLQSFFINNAQKQIANISNALREILPGIEPESPESLAIEAKLASLSDINSVLEQKNQAVLADDPFRGEAYSNRGEILYGTSGNPNQYIGTLEKAMFDGYMPSVDDIVSNFPPMDMASPQANHLANEVLSILTYSDSPGAQQRSQQVALQFATRQLGAMIRDLKNIHQNTELESPESLVLEAKMAHLSDLRNNMAQEYAAVMAADPTRGGAFRF